MADNQDLIDYFSKLPDGERKGPASEATLQKLFEVMSGTKGLGQTLKEDKKNMEESIKTLKKKTEAEDDAIDTLNDFVYTLRKNHRGLYTLGVGMSGLASQVIDLRAGVGDFANTIDEMADKSGNQYIKIVTAAFKKLAYMVDVQVDNFKTMSEVGIQFSEGLFTTRELALRAGLTLDTFSNAVATSADTLAILGGSVRAGTERFSSISNMLQKDFRVQAAGLGMTFEETTGLLTDYLDIQTTIGRSQFLTNRELNAGAQEFIMQLDTLSAITGKQRKMIAEQVKQDMLETRIQGILQSLEGSMVPGVQEILGSLQGLPAETRNAFKELIGTGGVPLSAFAQSLVRLNPEIASFARRVSFGQGSVEEFEQVIRNTAQRSQNLGPNFQRLGALVSVASENQLAANVELFRFTKFGEQRNQIEQQQAQAMKATSNQILDLKNSLKDIQNFFITALLPVLKVIGFVFGNVAKMANALTGGLGQTGEGVSKFVGQLGASVIAIGTLIGAVKLASLAFGRIGGVLGKILPFAGGGGTAAAVGATKALGAAGPAVAKGGAFAGLGIGALLGLSGAGAGLGIAAIGKGLQTFNNVDGKNLSDVAEATQKMVMAMVSGVSNGGTLAQGVAGLRSYAKSMSQALDDLDKDKLSLYTTKLEELAGAFREVNTSMSGAISSSGKTNKDKLDTISTILQEIKMVMEDVATTNKNISRKTSNTNVYNT